MKTIAIYPGSFAPFHIGHLNIAQKSLKMFDEVIIAVGVNPEKNTNKEDVSARCIELSKKINMCVMSFEGLLTDFISRVNQSRKDCRVVLVRGLRNGNDLDYEINQLRFMEELSGTKVDVVFIPCDKEFEHISSSAVRNISKLSTKLTGKYII